MARFYAWRLEIRVLLLEFPQNLSLSEKGEGKHGSEMNNLCCNKAKADVATKLNLNNFWCSMYVQNNVSND